MFNIHPSQWKQCTFWDQNNTQTPIPSLPKFLCDSVLPNTGETVMTSWRLQSSSSECIFQFWNPISKLLSLLPRVECSDRFCSTGVSDKVGQRRDNVWAMSMYRTHGYLVTLWCLLTRQPRAQLPSQQILRYPCSLQTPRPIRKDPGLGYPLHQERHTLSPNTLPPTTISRHTGCTGHENWAHNCQQESKASV
jgi:hypothetical protein